MTTRSLAESLEAGPDVLFGGPGADALYLADDDRDNADQFATLFA